MPQGSIIPFLQKAKPSRAGNSRPGQPYHSRPYPNSNGPRQNSTSQHRGPNRRRNTDLKRTADETKTELPKVLSSISSFNAAESSLHNLEDLGALSPNDCPGFLLPNDDVGAGKKGARIRVYDMDTFDAALHLDPNYKVYTHLGIPKPIIPSTSAVNEDSDMVMEDADVKDAIDHSKDNTVTEPADGTTIKSADTPDITSPMADPVPQSREVADSGVEDNSVDHSTTPTTSTGRVTKAVAVLNLASERSPGGGWQNGALAQEECLCYRSSLYLSLHKSYYPLPSLSAIYTPNVVLIRDAMSRGHKLLTTQESPANLPVTSVISVAALRKPLLTDDKKHLKYEGQRAETKRKIRITLRVAAHHGHTKLVLGALGCGVFANPPKEVAECFLEMLREQEFQGGWWEEVAFAVLDNVKGPHGGKDGDGNFGVFHRVLDGQIV